jgi:hypothetical protein
MSLFNKMFTKKEKPPTPQEAIQKIRDVEDLLEKKQQYLEKKIQDELANAKKHGTKNKKCKKSNEIILNVYFNLHLFLIRHNLSGITSFETQKTI